MRERLEYHSMPEPNSGCYLWLTHSNADGYGIIVYKGVRSLAHVAAYREFKGPTNGLHVLHKCDNPGCINPDHLKLGTNLDNIADKMAKQRQTRGENVAMSKLKEPQIVEIRASKLNHQEAANLYGVSRSLVYQIRRRMIWKHVK